MYSLNEISGQVKATGRTFYLVGLGIVATVSESHSERFERFVEKGKQTTGKRDGYELNKVTDDVTMKIKDLSNKLSESVQNGITSTLGLVGLPNRDEIKALTNSVSLLASRIEELQTKATA
jgi:poly(hydroxyalkanoate) granule-associated protein